MIDQLNNIGRHGNGDDGHSRPSADFDLTPKSKLFTSRAGSPNYLGDPDLLGKCATRLGRPNRGNARIIVMFAGLPPGLNKYRPRKPADVIKWDFISKAWYSDTDANPRRRIDSYAKEGIDDVVREVMCRCNATIFALKYNGLFVFVYIRHNVARKRIIYCFRVRK